MRSLKIFIFMIFILLGVMNLFAQDLNQPAISEIDFTGKWVFGPVFYMETNYSNKVDISIIRYDDSDFCIIEFDFQNRDIVVLTSEDNEREILLWSLSIIESCIYLTPKEGERYKLVLNPLDETTLLGIFLAGEEPKLSDGAIIGIFAKEKEVKTNI